MFEPVRIVDVDIGEPLLDIPAIDPQTGRGYSRARMFVSLLGQPVGFVDVDLGKDGMCAADVAWRVWRALGPAIAASVKAHGAPDVTGLGADGIRVPESVRKEEARLAEGPRVSVVIGTRDRPEQLEKCLRALLRLDYRDYELIVVDNAPSSDATAGVVRRFEGSGRVRYVREERAGVSMARNRGLYESDSSTIAFVDDDVVVDKRWLKMLVRGFCAAGNVGCVTGLVLPGELETEAQAWFEGYFPMNAGPARRLYDLRDNRPRLPLFPYAPNWGGAGASMAFRRSALQSIGGFDPALGPGTPSRGGEDRAVFLDIVKNGYTLVYEPAAVAHHFHRRDYDGLRRQTFGYGSGMTAYLVRSVIKHPSSLVDMVLQAPSVLRRLRSLPAVRQAPKDSKFPLDLRFQELAGLLYGPVGYLQGRWRSPRFRARGVSPRPSVGEAFEAIMHTEEKDV